MSDISALINQLVAANRILAHENVVDAFGHISARHPDDSGRFLLSRSLAPELIEAGDVMTFNLDGSPVNDTRKAYLERFIHGAIYEARPDVHSIVHSHSRSVVPFSVTNVPIRPLMHSTGAVGVPPVWDFQSKFGDTDLLVTSMQIGRDLAAALGNNATALMRGHGSVAVGSTVKAAVYIAVYLEVNAELQLKASALGPITYLTPKEVELTTHQVKLPDGSMGVGVDRTWDYWCRRAGVKG